MMYHDPRKVISTYIATVTNSQYDYSTITGSYDSIADFALEALKKADLHIVGKPSITESDDMTEIVGQVDDFVLHRKFAYVPVWGEQYNNEHYHKVIRETLRREYMTAIQEIIFSDD